MPTFAQNFKIGDVVYGISQSRAPYLNSLGAELRKYCEESGAFLLCDSFNNRSFLGVTSAYGTASGVAPSTIKNPQNATDIQHNLDFYEHDRGLTALGQEEKAAAKAFYDSLDRSRRSPSKAADEPQKKWSKLGDSTITMLMIRRACKFGLEYMLMTLQRQVHFVLDVPYNAGTELDMQDIVDKARYSGANRDDVNGAVPITFSEIRCCYRNRAQWEPTGRLKFYLNLNEVTPPWQRNPALWQQYDLARAKKQYAKKHPLKAKLGFGP